MSKKGSVDRIIDDAVIQHNQDLLSIVESEMSNFEGVFADDLFEKIKIAFQAERKKITDRFED